MIVLLVTCAGVPAALTYWSRRDPFDPRILFTLSYTYLTIGPCLFCLLTSQPHHPGLKTEQLGPALLVCSMAVLAFSSGATLAVYRTRNVLKENPFVSFQQTGRDRDTNSVARVMLLYCCVLSLALFAYFGYQVRAGIGVTSEAKAYCLLFADAADLRSCRYFGAASTTCLTFFLITDAFATKRSLSLTAALLMGTHFALCFLNGERDVLLVIVVWITANWRKLSPVQVVGAVTLCSLWLGISPILRHFGLGLQNQLNAMEQISLIDWLRSITYLSSNLHVLTNVLDLVPDAEPFWYGRSWFATLASFVPGDLALTAETPTRWFREVYDHQHVASFAFSQDAEAYLNFGWIGPVICFSIWGYLLGVAYRRAAVATPRTVDVFIWWHSVACSLFAIRSDSRGFIKMVVVGIAASIILWKVAELLTGEARNFRPRRGGAIREVR